MIKRGFKALDSSGKPKENIESNPKLELNIEKGELLKGYSFGDYPDSIEELTLMLNKRYKKDYDFVLFTGLGDDYADAIEIYSPKILKDKKVMDLLEEVIYDEDK